jgi:hypothetical protein
VRTLILVMGAVIATACGGGRGGTPVPLSTDPGPALAVTRFMQAVADSNLTRMAELWGTERGSAAETRQPANYQVRIAVIHTYLRDARAEVVSQIERHDRRSVLAVDVERAGCRYRLPFTVVRTRRGEWIVHDFDLGLIGAPGRPCP